jgi:preprotein translocase subunit SecE
MNIIEYIKSVQAEMTHVKWPTRKTTLYFSYVVIAVSIFTALYLGGLDYIFSTIIKLFI